MASLMRRAVQQAKATAAAEQTATSQPALLATADKAASPAADSRQAADLDQEPIDPSQLQLSGFDRSSSSSPELSREEERFHSTPLKTLSLGVRLGSMLMSALSIPRQGSNYVPIDADSSPEADSPDESCAQLRRTLPRDASLGQKLGDVV